MFHNMMQNTSTILIEVLYVWEREKKSFLQKKPNHPTNQIKNPPSKPNQTEQEQSKTLLSLKKL